MEYVIVNEKVTTWIKHTFQVNNVTSKQEAINKVVECYKQNKDPIDSIEDISILDTEEIYECEESMTVEDNNGYATIEVLGLDGEIIWDNGKIC